MARMVSTDPTKRQRKKKILLGCMAAAVLIFALLLSVLFNGAGSTAPTKNAANRAAQGPAPADAKDLKGSNAAGAPGPSSGGAGTTAPQTTQAAGPEKTTNTPPPSGEDAVFPLPKEYGDSYDSSGKTDGEGAKVEAADLTAPADTPVYSVTGGKVKTVPSAEKSSGWDKQAGWTVMVEASTDTGTIRRGDLFVYAHLQQQSSLKEGDTVTPGQQLGTVGDTGGDAVGATLPENKPHLSLGWYDPTGERATTGDGAMNPYPLLDYLNPNPKTDSTTKEPATPKKTGSAAGEGATELPQDPSGTGAKASDPSETDKGRMRMAALQYVIKAYGYTGDDKTAYLGQVNQAVILSTFNQSPGAKAVASVADRVASGGIKRTTTLDSFDVEKATADDATGVASFTVDDSSSGKKSYKERITVKRLDSVWRVASGEDVKEA